MPFCTQRAIYLTVSYHLKKNILIAFTFLIFGITFGQDYSSKKIEKLLSELIEISVNLNDYDYNVPLNEPVGRKETFTVNDKYTSNFISSKNWFADNEEHLIFIKIYRKGKISDFIKMTENDFPNIRVYGFWALLKNDKINEALIVLRNERARAKEIEWKPFGCKLFLKQSDKLMSEIFEMENNRRTYLRKKR